MQSPETDAPPCLTHYGVRFTVRPDGSEVHLCPRCNTRWTEYPRPSTRSLSHRRPDAAAQAPYPDEVQ